MLGMVIFSIGGFSLLIWNAYRRARRADRYSPEGKLRWDAETLEG